MLYYVCYVFLMHSLYYVMLCVAAAPKTYSGEIQAPTTTATAKKKKTQLKYENSTKESKLHFCDLQLIYICKYASYICYS